MSRPESAPVCPVCGRHAEWHMTRFGARHECCGLYSWGGRPLASPEEHARRRASAKTRKGFGSFKRRSSA